MKLSSSTITKLKNFATINPNLVYNGDGKLKTISEAKNILAEADLEEGVDVPFGVYDLNEFLSAMSLVDDGSVAFGSDKVTIESSNTRLEYGYADSNILTAPTKDVSMPDPEVTVTITSDELSAIRKASSALGNNTVQFNYTPESDMSISVIDSTGASSNTFSIQKNFEHSSPFAFDFLINNLKVIPGDYEVSLSSKLISRWVGEEVTYYIALEKTSNYAG